MTYTTEPIAFRTSPRQCWKCTAVATLWRFTRNVFGAVDKSSRQPTCEAHAQEAR